uniref:Peroxidasin homolog n=1 Tax=Saccoglossus kowalevskii TaxID=10224 RepID=A0ABM0MWT4_SACKO
MCQSVGTFLCVSWILCTLAAVYGGIADDPVLLSCFQEAVNDVDLAIHKSVEAIKKNPKPKSPAQLLRLFRFPSVATVKATTCEEVFETSLEIIKDHMQGPEVTPDVVEMLLNMSGCQKSPVTCQDMCFHSKYRTINGTCNNFKIPTQGDKADNLRAFDGKGGLRVGDNEAATGRPLLPFDPNSPMACLSDDSMNEVPCFLAGDVRTNEQIGLASMHTLFLREHNRISNILSQINPHWDDEQLYQEARKIVGATLQHITYDHYLPKILGNVGMGTIGPYKGYDARTNAAVTNVFSTAAFRFGHGTVKPILTRIDANFTEIPDGHLLLHLAFFQPWRIVEQGGIDPIIRGSFATAAKDLHPGEMMTDEMTERLFALSNTIALDLMSINIQRGRDHALPGYTEWVEMCKHGRRFRTFQQLKRFISNEDVLSKLESLYGHVNNIDLYIGALAEDPVEGSVVGPTFNCILSKQFKNTRDGDRFWYEKRDYFSRVQLAEIKKASLARVICDNTDIDQVQRDVFLIPDVSGGLVTCNYIEGIDLSAWTHQQASDNTAPSIQCPDDIIIDARSPMTRVSWPDPVASDDSSSGLHISCTPDSRSRFPAGVTIVTCTATDVTGNCASCSFSVNVQ